MAREVITPVKVLSHQAIDFDTNAVAANAADGMEVRNTDNNRLIIKCETAASVVTITGVQDGNRRTGNTVITIPISGAAYFTIHPSSLFGQQIQIDFDVDTDVKILAIAEEG